MKIAIVAVACLLVIIDGAYGNCNNGYDHGYDKCDEDYGNHYNKYGCEEGHDSHYNNYGRDYHNSNGCNYKCGNNGKIPTSLLPLILPTVLNNHCDKHSCHFDKKEVLSKLLPILNVLLTNCNNGCGGYGGCGNCGNYGSCGSSYGGHKYH